MPPCQLQSANEQASCIVIPVPCTKQPRIVSPQEHPRRPVVERRLDGRGQTDLDTEPVVIAAADANQRFQVSTCRLVIHMKSVRMHPEGRKEGKAAYVTFPPPVLVSCFSSSPSRRVLCSCAAAELQTNVVVSPFGLPLPLPLGPNYRRPDRRLL